MVKKYHQTKHDRKDESRGMKKYESSHRMDTDYFHMLSEDHSAVANLPQHVIQETYPKCDYFNSHQLDDTMKGLDDTRNDDIRNLERYPSDTKI